MRPALLLTVPLLVTLAGCAGMTPPPGDAWTKEMKRLQSGQTELSREVQRLRDNLLVMEGRLLRQEQVLDEVRGTVVAQKVTPFGEKAGIPAASAPSPRAAGAPAGSPTDIYLQAFADYASGRFDQAARGFETFLHLFPGSDYAGNAQYWLGECYYSRQQYAQAADAFRKVADQYPQGSKTPDALLKLSESLTQLQQPEQAREVLQTLRNRYPGSAAARKSLEER